MSTVSGALNSVATLFSYDLFGRWAPNISEHQLVVIGRCVTVVGMVVAISWLPFISRFESIFGMMATMICYIAPATRRNDVIVHQPQPVPIDRVTPE